MLDQKQFELVSQNAQTRSKTTQGKPPEKWNYPKKYTKQNHQQERTFDLKNSNRYASLAYSNNNSQEEQEIAESESNVVHVDSSNVDMDTVRIDSSSPQKSSTKTGIYIDSKSEHNEILSYRQRYPKAVSHKVTHLMLLVLVMESVLWLLVTAWYLGWVVRSCQNK